MGVRGKALTVRTIEAMKIPDARKGSIEIRPLMNVPEM